MKDNLAEIRRNLETALAGLDRLEDPVGCCERVVADYCESRNVSVQRLKCEKNDSKIVLQKYLLIFALLESFGRTVTFEVFGWNRKNYCVAKKRLVEIELNYRLRGRAAEIENERKFIKSLIDV